MAGPASLAATRPVMTKMPAPMMAPTPSEVRPTGPRTRRSRFSPSASAGAFPATSWRRAVSRTWASFLDERFEVGAASPEKIDGDARQHDQKAGPAEDGLDDQQR